MTKLTMRQRFDHIVAEATREIVELAHVYQVELPCELPLSRNPHDLLIAKLELDWRPRNHFALAIRDLLCELVRQVETVVLYPDLMCDGKLDVHRQDVQGIARSALHQRLEEAKVDKFEFLATEQYPRWTVD